MKERNPNFDDTTNSGGGELADVESSEDAGWDVVAGVYPWPEYQTIWDKTKRNKLNKKSPIKR